MIEPKHKQKTDARFQTAKQAIAAAGIVWTIAKVPRNDGQAYAPHETHLLVRRDLWDLGCGGVLGKVSGDYVVTQCQDVFTFFDPVIATGNMYYDRAGFSEEGKRIWLSARLQEDAEITSGDTIACYIQLSHSYELYQRQFRALYSRRGRPLDKSFDPHPITPSVDFRPVRLLTGITIDGHFSWRRVLSYEIPSNRIIAVSGLASGKPTLEKPAAAVLEEIRQHYKKLVRFFRDMAHMRMDETQQQEFVRSLFPKHARTNDITQYDQEMAEREQDIRRCLDYVSKSDVHQAAQGTLWSAYNAVLTYNASCPTPKVSPRALSLAAGDKCYPTDWKPGDPFPIPKRD